MSHIDMNNNHSVVEYTAGVTKPLKDQRLSVLFWKTDKTSGVKRESKCVSIPKLAASDISQEQLVAMVPHVLELLVVAQNKIIREAVESKGASTILGADITVAKCIEYLNEVGSGADSQRLTSEVITSWYTEVIEDQVMLAVSEKLGIGDNPTDEQYQKVEAICSKYKETIGKLASGSFKLPKDYAVLVKKVISFAPADDAIAGKLIGRLDSMINKSEDLLLAL